MRKQPTPEEIHILRASLKKLRAGRDLFFVYFDQGEDGAPVLVIDKKKIPPGEVKAMAARARMKRPVRGHVRLNAETDGADFFPLKSPGRLQKSLKTFYRRVPELQGARVVLRDSAELVAERMGAAEDEAVAAEASALSLSREEAQLRQKLALLEQQATAARFEVTDAQEALESSWRFWRKDALKGALGEATARSRQREGDLSRARAELEAVRAARLAAEQEKMHAEEDAVELRELWSALQDQQWEQRRGGDASWREDFQAEMQRLASVAEVSTRLSAAVTELDATINSHQARLRILRDGPTLAEDREAQEGQIVALQAELAALTDQREVALADAWRARDRLMEAERSRNAVFMTDDERDRAQLRRADLMEAQAEQIQAGLALDEARKIEEAAHTGLDEVRQLSEQLDALRIKRVRLQVEVDALQGKASQWTWFRASRAASKAEAAAQLASRRDELAAVEEQLAINRELLGAVEAEAGIDLEQAKAATAERLAAEAAHAAAELEVVRCEQEITEESATISEWHVDLRRGELSRLVAADPVARRADEERQFKQDAADRSVAELVDMEGELSALRRQQDEVAGRLAASSHAAPELTRQLVALSEQITEKAEAVERVRRAARQHTAWAEEATARFDAVLAEQAAALGAAGDERLLAALGAVEAAERELAELDEADAAAIEQRELLHDQHAELGRQEQVHDLVLDGEALVREHEAVFDALRDRDLFDSRDERAVEAAVGPALAEIRSRLDAHAALLIDAGATASELASVFERVPNGLRPAAYRSEVGAVDELMRRFEAMAEDQSRELRDKHLLKTATEGDKHKQLETIKSLLESIDVRRSDARYVVGQGAGRLSATKDWLGLIGIQDADSADAKQLGAITTFLFQLNTALGAVDAVKDTGVAFSAKNPDEDPVLQKLQDKQRLDALSGLVTAGLDITRHVVPLVALPWLGKGFIESTVEAATRVYRARTDTKLKALARMAGSELAAPLQESLDQEWRLAEQHGFDATASAAWIASSVLSAGPTASISFAIAVATKTTSIAHDVVTSARDWKLARKANDLLDRARAGDPRAKTELLKNHGRYAKGLLALRAQEGDAFALQYVATRGLEESDIRSSSFEIITRYLLKAAEQSEADHLETFSDWLAERRAAFGRLADLVVLPLRYVWTHLARWLDAPSEIDGLQLPPVDLPVDQAGELVALIRDGQGLRGRLTRRETTGPEDAAKLKTTLAQLDELLTGQRQAVKTCRADTAEQLEDISAAEVHFQLRMIDPLVLSDDDKRTMLELRSRLLRTRREHVELLNTLSEAL